ncbi:MAG: hypothetical protein K0R41_4593, partial [Geminicoccaceae bacterium]|nr:hypothetical protein [Geminicoccaceae bacterium]
MPGNVNDLVVVQAVTCEPVSGCEEHREFVMGSGEMTKAEFT